MSNKKPNLFLVGAPKCGTTSLYHYLRQHPDIFFPRFKEPHFFSTDLVWKYRPVQFKDANHYLTLFENAERQKWIGEASVWYLYSACAAANIKAFNPDARIICILRNPVDMLFSMYRFNIKLGSENITNFERALALEESRKQNKNIPGTLYAPWAILYKEIASYAVQLERYYQVYDKKNIHIIIYDDLSKNPSRVYQDILNFLGLPSYQIEFKKYNRTEDRSLHALRYLYRKYPEMYAGLRSGKYSRKYLHYLNKLGDAFLDRKVPPSTMSDMAKKELKKFFKPEIERIMKITGKDLTHWL